jgi:hypothetical protein
MKCNGQAFVISSSYPEKEVAFPTDVSGWSQNDVTWIYAGNHRNDKPSKNLSNHSIDAFIDAGQIGLLSGRHKALQISDSNIIIYLDDDVVLPTGWMEKILDPFSDPRIHIVGCQYLPLFEETPPGWLSSMWLQDNESFKTLGHLSLLDGGDVSRVYDPCNVWGLCYAIRKSTLIELGGFHPDGYPWELRRFRGDGETGLSLKAKAKGYMAYYQAETHVLHKVPKCRMTVEYFERRSFLQGISDSYSRIRERRAADQSIWVNPFKKFYGHLRQSGQRARILREPTEEGVKLLIARAYRDGFEFHQSEVRKDPSLLEWVLKPDYFDYRLPEGWEKYLQ